MIFKFLAFILRGQFLLPQRANNGKRDSPNLKIGYDRGVSVPGAFKIKYLDVGPQAQLPPPYAEDISALLTMVLS